MNHNEYIEYLKNKLMDNFLSRASVSKANERYLHSLGVAMMARTLAGIYAPHDEDFANKCEIAGILHDYGKFFTRSDYEELTKDNNIDFNYEEDYRQVYHGYYGYLALKRDLGIDDEEILMAVRNHIMGAPIMSLIEEIIYVSDLIEEGRSEEEIPILKPLRELALSGNLKKAVAFESKHVIEHLLKMNIKVNNISLDCYNGYCKYLKEEEK